VSFTKTVGTMANFVVSVVQKFKNGVQNLQFLGLNKQNCASCVLSAVVDILKCIFGVHTDCTD